MKLFKAMVTVGGMTGLSRIAGFLRDILTAMFLGAGPVADAFFVALKLPNFFRRITAEGAFTVSFVPVYTDVREKEGEEKAAAFAGHSFAIMFFGLSLFVIAGLYGMPWIIKFIAPGFKENGERYALAIQLASLTFPYLLLISLTALLGGVLNAHEKFAPFAFAPVLFNLTLIVMLFLSDTLFQSAGHAMAWGVFLSGFLQLGLLAVVVEKSKIKISPVRPVIDPHVKKLFKLIGPGLIGAGVMQINLFVDLILASLLETGSISYLYYADRLNQLPLGIVGIAIGTALLPMMSKALAAERSDEAKKLFNEALQICMILALPASTALIIIGQPIIVTLFEHGEFSLYAAKQTANVLFAYALGMPAYVLIKVYSAAYWAKQDTMTPVKMSVVSTIFNTLMSLMLIIYFNWDVTGIATATSLAGWLQVCIMAYGLRHKKTIAFNKQFRMVMLKTVFGCALMGGVLYTGRELTYEIFMSQEHVWQQSLALACLVLGGLTTYALAGMATRLVDIRKIKGYIKR